MNTAELKIILENIQTPQKLDSHPWADARFVQTTAPAHSPGEKLVRAVSTLFRKTMPGLPPKRGVRLDTRWAEFGLLAAQYFAPLEFGLLAPASLREACSKMDAAILYYVYGRVDGLPDENVDAYQLIGNEKETTPDSTLSDWHRKGIARLLQAIEAREQFLVRQNEKLQEHSLGNGSQQMPKRRRWLKIGIWIALISALLWGGWKAWRVYEQALIVIDDARQMQSLMRTPTIEAITNAGPLLSKTQEDFSALKEEAKPFIWMAPAFAWVPTYGGDIASVPALVEIADSVLTSADTAHQAGASLLDEVTDSSGEIVFDPPKLIGLLNEIGPEMTLASSQFQNALDARARLDVEHMSPRPRELMVNRVDPLLGLMHDALTLAVELPRVSGASEEGPKTYLVLVQNEDELRPTGGFLTAAGSVVVQNGEFGQLKFEDSGRIDDWENPYPSAPWQLSEYMNSPVMVFRDTNWFVDFPRSALYAESLYSYNKGYSVDGVIAIDQHALVELLRLTGPIEVEGGDEPVDANNVIAFMRESKLWDPERSREPGWNNKIFLDKISMALFEKIFSGDVPVRKLADYTLRVLEERHLTLQLDNPGLSEVLERNGWDGAIRREGGDFLMVVDSNIGFNKTNAVVDATIAYNIDLRNPAVPVAELVVTHTNRSSSLVFCSLRERITIKDQGNYPIDRCYWNYLRIYTVDGTGLLQANPQSIPAEWMLRGEPVSAHVDTLNEELDGITAYGLLKVVPGDRTLSTKLRYILPVDVLTIRPGTRQVVYRLVVKKQPGTIAVPISIQISLPEDVTLVSASQGSQVVDQVVNFTTTLRTDMEIEVVFEVP